MSRDVMSFKINGQEIDKFESVLIQKSMDTISGTFGGVTTDFFPGNPSDWNIKTGDVCTVFINNKKINTGYVDDFLIEYDTNSNTVQIIGRDKTEDLIDCSFDESANEWKNQSIANIVRNLCAPYDVTVVIDSSVTAEANTIIDTFKADEGEVISEIITRLCMDNAILPLCYNDGKLTLTKVSNRIMQDTIEVGVNAIRASSINSNKNRFSKYTVKGQGTGSDNKLLADFIYPSAYVMDSVITRNRPITIFADQATDNGKCLKKAKWEAKLRAGKSRQYEYVVEGWTQTNGDLWDINAEVRVRDTFFSINGTMLITDVVFDGNSEDGELTYITVVSKSAYDINDITIIKSEFDE